LENKDFSEASNFCCFSFQNAVTWHSTDNFTRNFFSGKHQEAENIISRSLEENLKLDTVAYNTFIKSMLKAGRYQESCLHKKD
jgi:hypothetical protein